MLIQVGDKVEVATDWGKGIAEGYITNIQILTKPDGTKKTGGVHTKEYDTSLNYKGIIDYQTKSGKLQFANFNQLRKVTK